MSDEQYQLRDDLLQKIGFQCYADYLASDLWRGIRNRFLSRHPSCAVCSKRACQVHHAKYTLATLNGKDDRWLISVCRGCHLASEVDESGRKRSWIDSQKEMLRLLRTAPGYKPKKPSRNPLSKRARNRKRWAERRQTGRRQ